MVGEGPGRKRERVAGLFEAGGLAVLNLLPYSMGKEVSQCGCVAGWFQ